MSTQGQIFALNRLCVFLADNMLLWLNISLIAAPIIGIKDSDIKWSQKSLEAAENLIFTPSKCVCKYLPCLMIKRQPQPPLILFRKDKTPHLVQFDLFHFLKWKHIELNFV